MSLLIKSSNFLNNFIREKTMFNILTRKHQKLTEKELLFINLYGHLFALKKKFPDLLKDIFIFIKNPSENTQFKIVKKILKEFEVKNFGCYKLTDQKLNNIFMYNSMPRKILLSTNTNFEQFKFEDLTLNTKENLSTFLTKDPFIIKKSPLVFIGCLEDYTEVSDIVANYLECLLEFIFMHDIDTTN